MSTSQRTAHALILTAALLAAAPAQGYVGPGAGFALLSSFLVVFVTMLLAALSLLLWPIRTVRRWLSRRRLDKPWARRLIVIGLDGQDAGLTERLLSEGKLPNLARLAERGCYHRLATTFPSVSPVAWSSFTTGTHPAKHAIFDFLSRDRRTYLPVLSSARIGSADRVLKLGKLRIPLARPELRLLRRSKPFWSILGEHGVWSTILRVPITFPPDRFYGAQLSAMSVPDLLGTQGTFLHYTTRPASGTIKEGGIRIHLEGHGDRFETTIQGPENTFLEGTPVMEAALVLTRDRTRKVLRVEVDGEGFDLEPGKLSGWVRVTFKPRPFPSVSGICRMMATELDDHVSLYLTPLNIDPLRPAMPISHPGYYATYLAKRLGPYATLGLAEDTWGVNEGVIDHDTFLQLTNDIEQERRKMFLAALERLRRGALVCVFDATDRIQHMFWRFMEDGGGTNGTRHRAAIEAHYRSADAFVGEVAAALGSHDVLMVLSDHGFTSFRRGVNLNAWLRDHGYLHLKPGTDGSSEWLRDVDWSRTRAYALGLTGLFVNLVGRESEGIVEPEHAQTLKTELIAELSGLVDSDSGEVAITEAFETAKLYRGPYLREAPDLLIGYNRGYRASWDGATGMASSPVFSDNEKAWSGDHCVDPRLVPGVLFCSHAIDRNDPSLVDIAPTALRLFGIAPPPHMDGSSLFEHAPRPKATILQESP